MYYYVFLQLIIHRGRKIYLHIGVNRFSEETGIDRYRNFALWHQILNKEDFYIKKTSVLID
jgi:DUF1680 family protein